MGTSLWLHTYVQGTARTRALLCVFSSPTRHGLPDSGTGPGRRGNLHLTHHRRRRRHRRHLRGIITAAWTRCDCWSCNNRSTRPRARGQPAPRSARRPRPPIRCSSAGGRTRRTRSAPLSGSACHAHAARRALGGRAGMRLEQWGGCSWRGGPAPGRAATRGRVRVTRGGNGGKQGRGVGRGAQGPRAKSGARSAWERALCRGLARGLAPPLAPRHAHAPRRDGARDPAPRCTARWSSIVERQ